MPGDNNQTQREWSKGKIREGSRGDSDCVCIAFFKHLKKIGQNAKIV